MSPVRKIGREEFRARMLRDQLRRRELKRAEERASYDLLWAINERKYKMWKRTHRRK